MRMIWLFTKIKMNDKRHSSIESHSLSYYIFLSTKEAFWLDIAGISWPHNRVIRRVKLHGNSNEADIIIDASSYEIERNWNFCSYFEFIAR